VVRFVEASGGRGTHVTVELEYEPVGGMAGVALAKVFGEEPSQQVKEVTRNDSIVACNSESLCDIQK
jgi:uncharacterized membrane protein